ERDRDGGGSRRRPGLDAVHRDRALPSARRPARMDWQPAHPRRASPPRGRPRSAAAARPDDGTARPVTALVLALVAGAGVHLVYTSGVLGGVRAGPRRPVGRARRAAIDDWLVQAGLGDVRVREFAGVMFAVFAIVAALTYVVFGAAVPGVLLGAA